MSIQEANQRWGKALKESIETDTFIKLSLGNYKGNEPELKNIYVRKVVVKSLPHLSFTYRYKTKDITKNFDLESAFDLVVQFIEYDFKVATLMTAQFDLQFEELLNGKRVCRELKASQKIPKDISHDRVKQRHIETNSSSYLYDLKILSSEGKVLKDAQDKFKQINHYIDLLRVMLEKLATHEQLHVVDMGSGKGYLTFALYDYLTNQLKINTTLTGIEFRQDMVDLCNSIAQKNKFDQLHFIQGRIDETILENVNVLIALHACDTATDDAIYKGIQAHADLIVVAPCCHKQIRREMEKASKANPLESVIRHGIFMERQAEMATDSLRALILEREGYKVKVFEFIDALHTPKNVMIVAEKARMSESSKLEIQKKIVDLKSFLGIGIHYLETLLQK